LALLLAEHPWIEDLLRPTGTHYLERTRSVPDELTIGSFAQSEGFSADELVSKINAWLTDRPGGGLLRRRPTNDARDLAWTERPR